MTHALCTSQAQSRPLATSAAGESCGSAGRRGKRDRRERLAAAGGSRITGVVDLNSYQPTYNQRTAQAPRINITGAGESSQLVDGGEPVEVTDINLEAGQQVISAAVQLEFIYE